MDNYDLTKEEWRKLCGRRTIHYSDIEKQHIVRLHLEGVPRQRIAFSLRMTSSGGIDACLNGLKRMLLSQNIKRRYREDPEFRRKQRETLRASRFRRSVCHIARNLPREERKEFAKDMGFSKENLPNVVKMPKTGVKLLDRILKKGV